MRRAKSVLKQQSFLRIFDSLFLQAIWRMLPWMPRRLSS